MKQGIKKAVVGVLAVFMVLSTGAASALSDSNGVCDNYTAGQATGREVGFSQRGRSRSFVDADGDGVCDNYGTRQGREYRRGHNK